MTDLEPHTVPSDPKNVAVRGTLAFVLFLISANAWFVPTTNHQGENRVVSTTRTWAV